MTSLKRTNTRDFCDYFVMRSRTAWYTVQFEKLADGTSMNNGFCVLVGNTPLAREVQKRVNKICCDGREVHPMLLKCDGSETAEKNLYRLFFENLGNERVRVCLEINVRGGRSEPVTWRPLMDAVLSWEGWIYAD